MNEKYTDWISNSQEWQDKLDRAIEKHGGNNVVMRYTDVAFAFPSSAPNPYSFDYPLIDQELFINWAESKRWKVQLAPEISIEEDKHRAPVRFTKKIA